MKVYIRFRPMEGEMVEHKLAYPSSSSSTSSSAKTSSSPKANPFPPLHQSLTLKLPEHSPTFTFPSGGVLPGSCGQDSVFKQCAEDAASLVLEVSNVSCLSSSSSVMRAPAIHSEYSFANALETAPLILFQGIVSCIFAYGQTGSGKTYTMTGGSQYEERGLIPRSITKIFQKLSKREGETKVFISYTEIYQECCYDLLDEKKRLKKLEEWDKVKTKEDSNGDLTLEGLRVYECEAEESALSLLFLGNMNRITSR